MFSVYFVFSTLAATYSTVSCVNVTVAIMAERSTRDLPFNINRSIGILELGIEKAREIVNQSADLTFIVKLIDIGFCTPFKFGAYAAEAYHVHRVDAFIGPGKK